MGGGVFSEVIRFQLLRLLGGTTRDPAGIPADGLIMRGGQTCLIQVTTDGRLSKSLGHVCSWNDTADRKKKGRRRHVGGKRMWTEDAGNVSLRWGPERDKSEVANPMKIMQRPPNM